MALRCAAICAARSPHTPKTDRWTHFGSLSAPVEALTDLAWMQQEELARVAVFAAGTGGNEYGQQQAHLC